MPDAGTLKRGRALAEWLDKRQTRQEEQAAIEPFSLLPLVGYYFLHRTSANTFIRKYFLPAPTPEKSAHLRREDIDQFKQTFTRKTDESLCRIVEERTLVANAMTAAQELLRERKDSVAAITPAAAMEQVAPYPPASHALAAPSSTKRANCTGWPGAGAWAASGRVAR